MFFKRSEKRSHGATLVLMVGALAAIGAISVTRCGKQMMHCMCQKVTGMFNKEKAMCRSQMQNMQ